SAEDLPFDRSSFGTVLSFDVFEHIPDSDRHLQEVNRVLKPDGHYIFQTPNKWLNMIFEPIRFTRKFGVRNAFDFLNEHCSLHNYWELEKRLKYNGFEVKYYDIPVVNQYFETKIKTYLGNLGILMLDLLDTFQFFERLPLALRPNFFVQAIKR
ncbi:MAG: class I SAM-dependent methyltransferase, partial [Smithella sp.]